MSVDIQKLKTLAEAACPRDEWFEQGDLRYCDDKTGETHGLHHLDAAFVESATPAAVLDLIAEIGRLKQHETANAEWAEKTEWVQKTAHWSELGMHRADVLRKRCDDAASNLQAQSDQLVKLMAENEALRKDAERWQFIRDEWPRVKLHYNGEWFNSEFLERKIDAAMSKEASHD